MFTCRHCSRPLLQAYTYCLGCQLYQTASGEQEPLFQGKTIREEVRTILIQQFTNKITLTQLVEQIKDINPVVPTNLEAIIKSQIKEYDPILLDRLIL